MRQFIRYLYEYGQGKRTRNVGFVKAEQDDRKSTIHIHGKGLRLSRGDSLKVYLIFAENGQATGIWQGEIAYMGPSINYRLSYTREDTGTEENYDRIGGILLENRDRRRFAALWEDGSLDVENMRLFANAGKERDEVSEEEAAEGTSDAVVRGSADVPAEGPAENMTETPKEGMSENIAERMQDTAVRDTRETADGNIPVSDGMQEGTPEAERENEEVPAEKAADADVDVQVQEEDGADPGLIKVIKIKRNEISRLPRCEWRLANNNFLLHGYYNYRYLALLDDGSVLRLGVPGIYHEKEARAAAGLGFPEFIGAEETVLADDEECQEEPRFGFWCRQVRRPAK
ncbi:MAG: hypothetical protein K1W34_11085 [Lachnospiraceae bacterium]